MTTAATDTEAAAGTTAAGPADLADAPADLAGAPDAPGARTPVLVRMGFRFSADGTRLACLAADSRHRWHVESWVLTADGPRRLSRWPHPGEATYSTVLPLEGGRVLLSRHRQGAQVLDLLDARGGVAASASWTERPLRLLVGAGGGYAVGSDPDGRTTVHRFPAGGAAPRALVTVPGRLSGGVPYGRWLLFTRVDGGHAEPVAVDPDAGTVTALRLPGLTGSARLLAAGGGSLLLAAGDGPRPRLALAAAAGEVPVRVLPETSPLAALPGTAHPVALDPTGRFAAHVGVRGARSALVLHDWTRDRVHEADLPAGVLSPVAAWGARGLWLPLATPLHPALPCWLSPADLAPETPESPEAPEPVGRGAATPRVGRRAARAGRGGPGVPGAPWAPRVRVPAVSGDARAAHPGRLESLPGARGPVEAVVHGPAWAHAERVVIALHGGPNSRWSLGYEPLFQALAAEGVAVVAPNQRGSTGYGAAYTLATVGDWGGPDLDDVLAVAAHLRAGRPAGAPAPALFGISYGAWLAVLAATAEPGGWSGCAAVAPFLSGARLHADGGPGVRDMVERLGGDSPRSAARDLERLAPRLATPLLLVHGRHDETVPVAHSRLLAAAAGAPGTVGSRCAADPHAAPGSRCAADPHAAPGAAGSAVRAPVRLIELPDRGHAALGLSPDDPVLAEVVAFLRAAAVPPPRDSVPPAASASSKRAGGHGTGGSNPPGPTYR
ncbi:alpha/beta fold hydrolase [Actinacidiphila sp. DG2A-62]|uniref:S9 family peptidase n=1 Tax=Actinacidiphila sp. DG2A-62 TaxID=3108821 RepID=UPI002DBEC159|nr:alpha/beta fold hydrolase [Actinacidiphila sp. DG2A-62]MEC3992482.1 alpha/beta fold hydrolase [Actinacidiphila sp. DG2A-62]